MGGWVDGWVGGWAGGRVGWDGWVGGWMNEWMHEWMVHGWLAGWRPGWVGGWLADWMGWDAMRCYDVTRSPVCLGLGSPAPVTLRYASMENCKKEAPRSPSGE